VRPLTGRISIVVSCAVAVLATACGASESETAAGNATMIATASPVTRGIPTPQAASPTNFPASAIRDLGSARYDPEAHESIPEPVSLWIEALGINGAPVVAVGVADDGELDVPPSQSVGWYRFGAPPGTEGSAVLAAHVAYNGKDGLFRHLGDLEPGEVVVVEWADGQRVRFAITSVERFPKSVLPDRVWTRTGAPTLALVTCGGRFDKKRRSFDDNVVAFARLI
jgi:hypothetical protein